MKARKPFTRILVCFAVITSLLMVPVETSAATGTNLDPSAAVHYNKRVTIKWKKVKGAKRYVVYRSRALSKSYYSYNGAPSLKLKKVKKLSSRKSSYKDKKLKFGKHYVYVIKAYKKKNGKWKMIARDKVEAYVGVRETDWYEYQLSDVPYSPTSVQLRTQFNSGGMKPTGYILERKTDGASYKRIANVKYANNKSGKFTDKNVKTGVRYTYRLRPYVRYKGKTMYGAYSSAFSRRLANSTGTYAVTLIESMTSGDIITLKLVSDKNNGPLVFRLGQATYLRSDDTDGENEDGAKIIKYSTDGATWKSYVRDKVKLDPGKTLYLQYKSTTGRDFDTSVDFMLTNDDSPDVTYNDLRSCVLDIHIACKATQALGGESTASAYPLGEYYH